jgi:hypothetical protein
MRMLLVASMMCIMMIFGPITNVIAQQSPARIQFATQYTTAGSLDDAVTSAMGFGFVMLADWRPTRFVGAVVQIGLDRLDIAQDDVIPRWDWAYWERYYQRESSDLLDLPTYEAQQIPVQEALMVGAAVMPALNLERGALTVQLAGGPSITYYSRRLYLDEEWTRHYPEIDFSFGMHFRNYAEDKTGYEFGADARFGAGYRVSRIVTLMAGLNYRHLFADDATQLPLNDFVALQLGVAFKY